MAHRERQKERETKREREGESLSQKGKVREERRGTYKT